ncbi:hypothetical protein BHM03_00023468 [Ensete ventricosum]|nr:hypothetical protein BHM03_00023468 [Ensete ventricosum]
MICEVKWRLEVARWTAGVGSGGGSLQTRALVRPRARGRFLPRSTPVNRFVPHLEALRTSSINSSPNHAQSPEVSSMDVSHEVNETIKNLNEKLSAALLNISAKEDLVKRHVKLAEEALLGNI